MKNSIHLNAHIPKSLSKSPTLQAKHLLLQLSLYLSFKSVSSSLLHFCLLLLGFGLLPQMGCSQSSCTDSDECENDGKNQVGSSLAIDHQSGERSSCKKMKWGLNLIRRWQRRGIKDAFENNKTWLLGESVGVQLESVDPQLTHSSFRFSFGSQAELESLSLNSSTTTVIMVNLEKGSHEGAVETRCRELQMRRIESLERNISSVAGTLVRFSYAEIRSATKDFSRGKVLGRGAHSCVYRGRLRYGRAVAIKRLNNEEKETAKDFCRELMIASSLHNRNVVPLVGFCIDQDGLFLVYKYVSGGSLERHLHDNKRGKSSPLSWSTRYKVAIGIAEAIAYLHNGTEKCVIHRDIKPSNILLSSKKTPKLCDFGLATWTQAPSTPFLCKTVKGTFGYLAPEYFQHGKVSDKTDVYAFGVVLLELITGRKPIETRRSHADENLVLWAKPLLQQEGDTGELLDPQIRHSSYSSSQVSRMVHAAAACVNSEESQRPSINQVVAILRGDEHRMTDKSSNFSKNSCIGFYHQQTKSDVNGHLALAMLGVS